MITSLKQAKNYIQNLNSMIKSLNEKIDDMWDTIEDCEGEISQLRKEKEKLKDDLSDCICSNELLENEYNLLDKEYKFFRAVLSEISFKTPALGGDKKEMKRALLDIDELCRMSLDRYDEE